MKVSKGWTRFGIVAVLIYTGLSLLGSNRWPPIYTIESEIDITASPQEVWDLLVNFDGYPQWNPYLVRIEGTFEEGKQLAVTLVDANFSGPFTVKPTVSAIDPVKEFFWSGTLPIPGIMDTRHVFAVQPLENGTTHFIQYEEFRGLLPLLLPDRDSRAAKTREAFRSMNTALRQQFE